MTEQQSKLVEPILNTIQNDDIREFAVVLLEDLPDYIWHCPASSSSRFHPMYSLGEQGLMRHQIAVARFLNFFFELEQYNSKMTSREMDLLRIAGLVHDGRKSGEQSDYEKSKSTKFNHPIVMASAIRKYDGQYLNHEELELIASCIETHMGQFNTDKRSSVVLPKPINNYQRLVHLADYLASRKCLTMDFDNYEVPKIDIPPLDDYVIEFGKHAGTKLVDLWQTQKGYVLWCEENIRKEPLQTLIKQLKERNKN